MSANSPVPPSLADTHLWLNAYLHILMLRISKVKPPKGERGSRCKSASSKFPRSSTFRQYTLMADCPLAYPLSLAALPQSDKQS